MPRRFPEVVFSEREFSNPSKRSLEAQAAMKDLDLTSMRYFVAVCEAGSLSRAAERENVVTSAISKRLSLMESQFGIPLLQRQHRGVVPTPAGETLLEHSRAMLSSAQRVVQDMASFAGGVRGQVRLLATVSSIAECLPDDVALFMKQPQHRQIQVHIQEASSREIVRRLREGSASVGVLWDAADLQGLCTLPYRTDHISVVVQASHPLGRRKQCAFVDTLPYEHVSLEGTTAVNSRMERAAAIAGQRITYRATVSNFESALRVVRANLGLSIIPREIAASHAATLGLKIIPLTDEWAKRRFAICYRSKELLPKSAALLVDYLAGLAKKD
ncbi:MAG TPA: LysR family transcriptional regulator [Ramlibacter sp.]|uniref:LysR family transcriptional regulator n=1 Tax=Ramlibacter sp. TaxID=1917967 RepID=UPI002D583C20|nr:LysR family transcriptional regulator [Ramlibacter sp.]HZY19202.1 LysR family transcriptional regulator [Ramlibacter sp.]